MRFGLVVASLVAASSLVGAQTNAANCPASAPANTEAGVRNNAARDACLQAVDVFQFMAPQLGISLTGGNATLGQGGTLGGLGHFALGIRGNIVRGDVPEVDAFPEPRTSQDPSPQTLPSKSQVIGLPVVDLAIGLFKGIPLPLTNALGVDLLVNAAYVPELEVGDVAITPKSNLKLGWGARVGLLQESIVIPGVSVTFIQRDVPTTTITARTTDLDFDVTDADIKTTAWRLVASKSFLMFGLAAGFGQDSYDLSTSVSGTAKNIALGPLGLGGTANQTFGPVALAQDMNRTNMFLDLSLNLPFVKLVGEIGQVSGGVVENMTNTFSSNEANASRMFGSIGVRLGW